MMQIDLEGKSAGPLTGIRVVELAAVVSGPMCSQTLGDLGAEVIKIETPIGDTARMMGPPFKAGMTGFFAQFNRNKRSIALDLKHAEGVAVAQRLASAADVLIENYRPGVVERLGMGYDILAARNPKLIYVSINGFGPQGPYAAQPAYDTVIQGLAGFMPTQGHGGAPQLIRSIVADKASALTATYAILAALFARERNGGRGQRIEIPMLDAYAAFILPDVFSPETFVPKEGAELPFNPSEVHRTWETKDGHVVLMIIEDRQFHALCRALEREDLIHDPRCSDLLTRIMHLPELFTIIEEELKKWPTADIVARARQFECPLAPAYGIEEFLRDPQVAVNRTVFETEHDEIGRMRFVRNPVRFGDGPATFRRRPPHLGEHGEAILREMGYGDEEIAALRAGGAVK